MRKNITYAVLLLVAGMMALSCEKGGGTAGNNDEVLFSITPTLLSGDDLSASATRSPGPINDKLGRNNTDTLGIFITKPADHTAAYYDGTMNIPSAVNYSDSPPYYNWYYWEGNNQKMKRAIPMYKSMGAGKLYSYHPYNAAVTNIKSIPFDLTARMKDPNISEARMSVTNDYLWAEPVDIDPTAMTGISTVYVDYHHLMALLTVRLNTSHTEVGNHRQTVRRVELETVDGNKWLVTKGNYDGSSGVITGSNTTSSLTYYCKSHSDVNHTVVIDIMFVPMAIAESATDRKLKMTFYLGEVDEDQETGGIPLVSGPVELDLAKFATAASPAEHGLVAGYKYSVSLRYNNYVILEEFEVLPGVPWTNENVDITI